MGGIGVTDCLGFIRIQIKNFENLTHKCVEEKFHSPMPSAKTPAMPPKKKRPPDPSNADAHKHTEKRRALPRLPDDEDSNKQNSPIESENRQPKTSNWDEPNPPQSTSSSYIGSSDIVLRLSQSTLNNTKLQNPRILTIPNAVYVTEPNGTTSDGTTHYLYDLVCRIFECELSDVKLYRQPDGAFRNEHGHGWQAVDHHGEVKAGIYLCKVQNGISPTA